MIKFKPRNSHWNNKKTSSKSVPFTAVPCQWWSSTKGQYSLNQKECPVSDHLSYVHLSLIQPLKITSADWINSNSKMSSIEMDFLRVQMLTICISDNLTDLFLCCLICSIVSFQFIHILLCIFIIRSCTFNLNWQYFLLLK